METRRRTRRVQVQSSDSFVGTGVHAPSQVATNSKAASNAAALGSALNLGGKFAAEQIEIGQNKDRQAGAQAAMEGKFTDEELHQMEQSAAYVQGAQSVLAKQRIIEDSAAATEWYQREFDKGAGLDDLRHGLNQFWSARYAGVSTGIAREIAPLMAQASDSIMSSHAKFQAAETQDQLIQAQTEVLSQALKGGNYDWNALRTQGNSILGKDTMNAVAVDAISRHAAESLDETVWDRKEFSMLRQNHSFRDDIDKNINDTRTARFKAGEEATINAQGAALAELGSLADAGDPRFVQAMPNATQANADGVHLVETDTQSAALWARYMKAIQSPADTSVNTTLWAQGNGRTIAKDADRDAAAMADAQSKVEQMLKTGKTDEEGAAAAGRAYLIERSTINNYLPKQLRGELEISPTHPNFSSAVDLYDQFEAERPGWVAEHMDSNTVREIRSYKRHLTQTGDPQKALERINTNDPSLYSNLTPKMVSKAENQIVDDMRDGLLWSDNGISDSDRLRGLVKDDFKYYVEQGLGVEAAMEQTMLNLDGRYVAVGGELYLTNEGWGSNANEALNVALEAYAMEQGQTEWWSSDSPNVDMVRAMPVPNKPGYVRFSVKGSLMSLGSMTEVPISDVMGGYTAFKNAAAALAEDRQDVDLETKARNSLTPIPISVSIENPELYQRMVEERDRKWNSLTPAQRDAHKARQRR